MVPMISIVTVYKESRVSLMALLRAAQDLEVPHEHIVVAAETDAKTEWLINRHGARYVPIAPNAALKDARGVGTYAATGKYVTWWDECFFPRGGFSQVIQHLPKRDVTISRVNMYLESLRHERPVPTLAIAPNVLPAETDVHASCYVVKREIAVEEDWRRIEGDRADIHDHTWLSRVVADGATFQYTPNIVGDVLLCG